MRTNLFIYIVNRSWQNQQLFEKSHIYFEWNLGHDGDVTDLNVNWNTVDGVRCNHPAYMARNLLKVHSELLAVSVTMEYVSNSMVTVYVV